MNIPWVEKYRPIDFDDIVLDAHNKHFFNNLIRDSYIPNMLFYGPPGTGKTTTIINLIRSYQEKHNEMNNGLMLHLNASDERGIDTIRTQIFSFVNTKTFFKTGAKFVILDEVDSMTKNAQQALSCMLHSYVNVRFCLICNYISKIDETLQTMFIKIKFNKLPKPQVITFLQKIILCENLNYTTEQLQYIQCIYDSDIRSMINFIQMNQDAISIIHYTVWDKLYTMTQNENINNITSYVYDISKQYNMDIKTILKDFVFYVCVTYKQSISKLSIALHNIHVNPDNMVRYVMLNLM